MDRFEALNFLNLVKVSVYGCFYFIFEKFMINKQIQRINFKNSKNGIFERRSNYYNKKIIVGASKALDSIKPI